MDTPERAMLFVDGANLYRAIKGLDLVPQHFCIEKIAAKLAGPRQVRQIRYYIAEVDRSGGAAYVANQILIQDLRQRPSVHLELGYISRQQKRNACATELRSYLGGLQVRLPPQVWKDLTDLARRHGSMFEYTEKGVDVALACDMADLAARDEYDVAYLLSGDGDFCPAVRMARAAGRRVFAASPHVGLRLQEA